MRTRTVPALQAFKSIGHSRNSHPKLRRNVVKNTVVSSSSWSSLLIVRGRENETRGSHNNEDEDGCEAVTVLPDAAVGDLAVEIR